MSDGDNKNSREYIRQAALDLAVKSARFYEQGEEYAKAFTALGDNLKGLLGEAFRPCGALLAGSAKMFEGLTEVNTWVTDRLIGAAKAVASARDLLKEVNDAADVPTLSEIDSLLESTSRAASEDGPITQDARGGT